MLRKFNTAVSRRLLSFAPLSDHPNFQCLLANQ